MEAMDLLDQHFSRVITCLIHLALMSKRFLFNSQFCEQKNRIAMGSYVSLVIDNYNLQQFKAGALDTAILKPSCWFRYVNDSFVIWPHSPHELRNFFCHLNSIYPKSSRSLQKPT
jgi:hypothetical protein